MDETYNHETNPPISSLTGILIPLEKYPMLRSKFYEILQFEGASKETVLNINPPELHFVDFLRNYSDEVKFDVLWSLVNLVAESQIEIFRLGYYITKKIEKTFESDKRLIGVCWLGILFMLESKLESELIVPVMDAGFEKNMKQMTKQFSWPMKFVNVMREAVREEDISIKNSNNILDVFYADSEFSIFTQLADVVSGLRRITETSNHDEQLITSPFKKHLLPISQHLLNTPMREKIVALNLNGKVQGPSSRTNTS